MANNQQAIVVKFCYFADKQKILRNQRKLKETDIFISSDRTKQERVIQGNLFARAKEERRNGKSVKTAYHKIIIDNEIYVWRDGIGLVPTVRSLDSSAQRNSPNYSPFRATN